MKISGPLAGALGIDSAFAAFDEMLAAIAHQRVFSAFISSTQSAANISIVELQNPGGSTKNLYLFLGECWSGTGIQFKLTFGGTSLSPVGVPIGMFGALGTSVAKVGGGNQLAPTGTIFLNSAMIPSNTTYLLPNWFWAAIPPGSQLQIQASAVNIQVNANLRWIELSA